MAATAASASLAERLSTVVEGDVRPHEPMAPWTTLRVGGPAEALVKPSTPDALVCLLRFVRDEGIALTLFGGGANTLVGDGGIQGATLRLPPNLLPEELRPGADGGRVTLGAGAAISRLIVQMRAAGLVGAEFLAGIPGTIGGAVAMNAGTKHGECMSVVEAVELATADGLGWVDRAALPYRYRHTQLPPGAVVTRVRFLLPRGDLDQSQRKMDEDLAYRRRTQPLSQPNCGSVFQNPPGDHAGRLIEAVGLKGHVAGGAQVSPLHANWIVNLGSAKARDVVELIELAQARVQAAFGVTLNPEVKRVGVFA